MGLKTWYDLYKESKERLKKNKDYEIVDMGEYTLMTFALLVMSLVSMGIVVVLKSVVVAVFFGILSIIFLMCHFRSRDNIYAIEKEWK